MDEYLISVLSNIGVVSFVALSAYLLLLTGEISFGQQAFFAIGAYAAGIATAMWGWPLALALVWGAAAGAVCAVLVGIPTLRVRGVYFAIATLAFAEMVRILFELFRYQVEIDGELVGPDGTDGFRNIRYIFEKAFGGERGQGYPAERRESQVANAGILAQVKQGASKPFLDGLRAIDPELVKQAVGGERFRKAFFDHARDDAIRAYVAEVLDR
jgi:hypothetical protein